MQNVLNRALKQRQRQKQISRIYMKDNDFLSIYDCIPV
jgi:hypothetical protein